MSELIFEVTQEGDGGYCAECLTEAIFTQGDTWEALCNNVREAVDAFNFDRVSREDLLTKLRCRKVRYTA